jgi:hypothetical protein
MTILNTSLRLQINTHFWKAAVEARIVEIPKCPSIVRVGVGVTALSHPMALSHYPIPRHCPIPQPLLIQHSPPCCPHSRITCKIVDFALPDNPNPITMILLSLGTKHHNH